MGTNRTLEKPYKKWYDTINHKEQGGNTNGYYKY